ncbi:helix-turn-helix domain-containing protein [Hyphomicrobium sp. CS1GBMeth3]|uniref:winged helix-turn-helix domain-containing protein n=1 Tax=Hyphomicrobium sp. CS1GBMeth3 TaxID=1892845 RepID=UPI000931B8A0|nr:helix-turn-helix domain-containing protein [Hyphomicrobium sp. CS1GBMeth3]
MGQRRYGDLVFDATLLFAERGNSERLRFTRNERALLNLFMDNPERLLSRGHILDAITHADSDISDRNVDFLVNRLRTKLGDSARAPRFIATQYGEGYVWIAKSDESVDAFVVIGPCHGLRHAETAQRANPVLSDITQTLARLMENKHAVVLKPDWSADAALGETSYSVDASLHADGDLLHGAFVLRDGGTGQILKAFRAVFSPAAADDVCALATHIKDAIWAHQALPLASHVAATDTPLELRMHDAALLLSRTPESWQKAQEQIERARANDPHDPMLAIMQGFALYVGLLQRLHSPDEWRAAETEIETLVFNSLPAIQDNSLLVLGAAKLLFFIGRGNFDLASRLADEAFEKSTAFAAAFSTRAQMRMAEGEFAKAHLLYDKAIELSEPGSEFFIYLKILKSTAALADNDRAAVDAIASELYALNPHIRIKVGIFLASPDVDLPPDIAAVFSSYDAERASWIIMYLYNVSARHFHVPEHRRNIMRGLITHLSRHFGENIVPAEVRNGIGR